MAQLLSNLSDLDIASDQSLMKAITGRHQPALRAFHDRYRPFLKSVVLRIVHEEAEADDVLQEVFLQIWKEADKYSPQSGRPLGWVVTIARRRAIDRLRRHLAYSRAKERFGTASYDQTVSEHRDRSEDDFVRNDLRSFLKEQMKALPVFQREVVELSFFKGMSQREIAAFTGTPLGTVKTRLELGLRKLTASIRPLGKI